ncbi:expressed unknown protein [Seminavis robusta]|uniref:Uncharacterized protein n=1 Tax=Seminavis robusta TaxID=568900 RepID=A0A9N8DIX0_9STRA|nr:expressed unknown protein [Seminavis robusta]|eukprot:Sro168_g074730.1 n/a (423) ;mRNA; f:24887-26521
MFSVPKGNSRDVEEESPFLRSVAVMGGAPKLTPLSATPKFGKAPAIGLPKPKIGLSQSRTSFTVTQEWTSAAAWDVKSEDLELVPVDFPLERTHREIRCDASEVAKRISDSLKHLSIDAKYDNENAKAKCKTMECVKFRIRLYAGGENGQPVVVEVQRRSGSTSSFMRSCRAVLDAAEGAQAAAAAPQSGAPKAIGKPGKFPPPMKSLGAMKCLQSVSVPGPTPEEEAAMAFDSAASLCKSGKHDSVVLGLESLCNLTDPLKSSPKTSIQVSKWVLLGHETHTTRDDITAILNMVPDEEEEDLLVVFGQQKHFAVMALANALDMCAKDGCLASAVTEQSWFESSLVPSLLAILKDAVDSASNAYAAARGLSSLLSSSNATLPMIEENNGVETLKMAHEFGLQNHDLLASEAAGCLESVKGSH